MLLTEQQLHTRRLVEHFGAKLSLSFSSSSKALFISLFIFILSWKTSARGMVACWVFPELCMMPNLILPFYLVAILFWLLSIFLSAFFIILSFPSLLSSLTYSLFPSSLRKQFLYFWLRPNGPEAFVSLCNWSKAAIFALQKFPPCWLGANFNKGTKAVSSTSPKYSVLGYFAIFWPLHKVLESTEYWFFCTRSGYD